TLWTPRFARKQYVHPRLHDPSPVSVKRSRDLILCCFAHAFVRALTTVPPHLGDFDRGSANPATISRPDTVLGSHTRVGGCGGSLTTEITFGIRFCSSNGRIILSPGFRYCAGITLQPHSPVSLFLRHTSKGCSGVARRTIGSFGASTVIS